MIPANGEKPSGLWREEALQALREAVWDVIVDHKRLGLPLVVWRDGKVAHISAEEAEAEYLAAKAKVEAEATQARSGS